mmetsp:Transcript_71062/g.162956  ORF Transcript_71062/g.162956 Transcript_71062/m.162956 type:complete len:359 (-) Transcript_71062:349-1425(-)
MRSRRFFHCVGQSSAPWSRASVSCTSTWVTAELSTLLSRSESESPSRRAITALCLASIRAVSIALASLLRRRRRCRRANIPCRAASDASVVRTWAATPVFITVRAYRSLYCTRALAWTGVPWRVRKRRNRSRRASIKAAGPKMRIRPLPVASWAQTAGSPAGTATSFPLVSAASCRQLARVVVLAPAPDSPRRNSSCSRWSWVTRALKGVPNSSSTYSSKAAATSGVPLPTTRIIFARLTLPLSSASRMQRTNLRPSCSRVVIASDPFLTQEYPRSTTGRAAWYWDRARSNSPTLRHILPLRSSRGITSSSWPRRVCGGRMPITTKACSISRGLSSPSPSKSIWAKRSCTRIACTLKQ